MVFLAGPSGVGKSTLGRMAAAALGLRFADLDDDGDTDRVLREIVETELADVVALPWAPDRDLPWLRLCRRAGFTVALWVHPLELRKRSGRAEMQFTPSRKLRSRGGFGRTGTACREYRHLERACGDVLLLNGLSEEAAALELQELIEDLRTPRDLSPAQQEGLDNWVQDWKTDFNADLEACRILVDAMARFTMTLKARGASPRRMAAVYNDLNYGGFLVMCYDAPRGKDVLRSLGAPPGFLFRKNISESPHALARFQSTWKSFVAFLRSDKL